MPRAHVFKPGAMERCQNCSMFYVATLLAPDCQSPNSPDRSTVKTADGCRDKHHSFFSMCSNDETCAYCGVNREVGAHTHCPVVSDPVTESRPSMWAQGDSSDPPPKPKSIEERLLDAEKKIGDLENRHSRRG